MISVYHQVWWYQFIIRELYCKLVGSLDSICTWFILDCSPLVVNTLPLYKNQDQWILKITLYFTYPLIQNIFSWNSVIRFEIAFEQLPIDLFFQTASLNISLNCLIITTRSGSLISLIYINWHFLFIKFADRRLWIGYLHSGENWFLQFNICNRSITIIIHS